MNALDRVRLTPLMEQSSGRPEIAVALIDGPVLTKDAAIWSSNVRYFDGNLPATCSRANSSACTHGTLIASILVSKRGSGAPAICPECTLLVRPIFSEENKNSELIPSATADELAQAIMDAVDRGASVLNLSVSIADAPSTGQRQLEEALSYAAVRDVVVVVAAGSQGTIGGSVFASHPWAISVIASDHSGHPLGNSNLSASTGKRGLSAPGENITAIGADGEISTVSGQSPAVAFVAGAAALLRSVFSHATAAAVKVALTSRAGQRRSLVPPLLDAWRAYQLLVETA